MQASVEEVNSVQRRLKINVNPETVNAFFLQTTKDIQRKADLRGFRKGKAPIALIKKMYADNIAREVAQKIIEKHLFAAIESHQIKPISNPVIENVSLPKEDADFAFTALVDILPKIDLKNYKNLTVVHEKKAVTADDVQKELQALQKRHAKTKTLDATDTAKAGLVAKISSMAKFPDGHEFRPYTFQNANIELGSGQLPKEFDEALTGLRPGEEKKFTMQIPEHLKAHQKHHDHEHPDTVEVQIKLEELSELVLPPLDDEFAKDLNLESLATLQTEIEQALEQTLTENRRKFLEDNLLNQIMNANAFEVPPALTDRVIDNMIANMRWPDEKMRERAMQDEKMRENFREPAKRQAKNSLILWEIARLENVNVSEADLDEYLNKTLDGSQYSPEQRAKVLANIKKSESENLRERLLFSKAMDFVINSAIIKE